MTLYQIHKRIRGTAARNARRLLSGRFCWCSIGARMAALMAQADVAATPNES